LRIIGGNLKGRKLHKFRGADIRPTADRLRESIFDILGNRVQNKRVLDLFAGTGALGLEALSRGAETAVFIDNRSVALALIRRNISTCQMENRSETIKWDITKNLNCLKPVIVEHADAEAIPEHLTNLLISDRRRYGKTIVSILKYVI